MSSKNRYKELDALRGIAALLVVLFHFTVGKQAYNQFFKLGTTGVDLFFIISGFVIIMSLQKISTGLEFVINRVSRLYPTYWASVTFTFLLIIAYSAYKGSVDVYTFTQYVANLTMFQFYLNVPDLDGPYWTMIIEMIFYMSILLLFYLDLLAYINTIGVVVCSLVVILTQYFHGKAIMEWPIYWIPLLQFIPLFFAGTVFYKIHSSREKSMSNYLILLFCLACQMIIFPYAGRSRGFVSWPEYNMMLFIYFALFTLFVNYKLSFIVNDITLFFGKISFALYLIHQYISLYIIIPVFYDYFGINFWLVIIFINLPIVVGVAYVITYKIEIPYSRQMKEKMRTLLLVNKRANV